MKNKTRDMLCKFQKQTSGSVQTAHVVTDSNDSTETCSTQSEYLQKNGFKTFFCRDWGFWMEWNRTAEWTWILFHLNENCFQRTTYSMKSNKNKPHTRTCWRIREWINAHLVFVDLFRQFFTSLHLILFGPLTLWQNCFVFASTIHNLAARTQHAFTPVWRPISIDFAN